jgi:6-phosphogluconolactonase (cycloisomerase 2 family)
LCVIFAPAAVAACLALAGCGSSSSNPPPPPPSPLGHAYVTTGNGLFGYAISASNGGLTAVTTPMGAPGGTAVVGNAQKFLLYTLTSGGQISGYSVNSSNGSLTAVAGSPFGGAGVGVAFMAVGTAGQYLFVPATQDFNVVPYTINPVGTLTIGLQVGTPAAPLTATVDPQAHFLYVPMGSAGSELYKITGGALTDMGTIPPLGATKPQFVAITPSDTFAYISDGVTGVAAYSVNSSTGALTALPGAPFTAGPGPSAMAMTPNGNFLYVATTPGLVSFAINSDGSLTSIGSAVAFTSPPIVMNIDPSGSFLYVISVNSSTVAIYLINQSTGVLTAEQPAVVPAAATGIATTP